MSQGFAVSLQLSKVKVNNEKEMLTHVFEESDIEIGNIRICYIRRFYCFY